MMHCFRKLQDTVWFNEEAAYLSTEANRDEQIKVKVKEEQKVGEDRSEEEKEVALQEEGFLEKLSSKKNPSEAPKELDRDQQIRTEPDAETEKKPQRAIYDFAIHDEELIVPRSLA